jgi:hypothetical protein
MAAPQKVMMVAKNTTANAAVLILLAVFLAAIVWRGNAKVFATTVWADITGQQSSVSSNGAVTVTGSKGPAFWQWAIALIVLYALAENSNTSHIFGPLLAIMVVAMLIQLAEKNPTQFANLSNGVKQIFGGS